MALTWRKSSRSSAGSGNSGGDCVEVAFGLTGPLLRDSKCNGEVLRLSQAAFDTLLHGLQHDTC
ncbi:MAG TPA: DUF397 domain-containing protein [Actinophytocola sp.]|uniref:DUF397 domain-containing protein n=1 Tax=Actinophytocola sp. TaxID=1872138 RepID=UPI002DFF8850|nr:DUF397 domain-containing protein [Actinophytocola sp.]